MFHLVCGDDQCTAEIGETCDSCARDCCPSSMNVNDAIGITIGVVLFVCVFVTSSILIAISAVSAIVLLYLFMLYS